eukprot:TRINITY_DN708_c0_g1_i1.p1 TRINITY_DN708_c0_g1~~TRINITY_DN708_c0_g1_i1.p1  ORF type:complete len:176 (+),score=45.89 TRINITY_DN708_c0_g1_i1:23-550(+)
MAHAPCKWAQRKDKIYLTVELSDSSEVSVQIHEKAFDIKAKGKSAGAGDVVTDWAASVPLFKEVNTEESNWKATPREIQILLKKKENGYWDRLTEATSRTTKHWLTCDWDKWKDEDEDDGDIPNFGGDFGGGDFGGFGGDMDMGGDSDDEANLDDLNAPAADSAPAEAADVAPAE